MFKHWHTDIQAVLGRDPAALLLWSRRRIPLLSVFAPLVSRIPISLIANEPAWKDSQAAPDPRYVRNPALFVLRSMAAYALLFVPVGLLLYYLSQSPALRAVAGWRYFPVPDILGDAAAWFGMFATAYLCFFLVLLARDIYSKERRYTVFLPWNFFSSTTSSGQEAAREAARGATGAKIRTQGPRVTHRDASRKIARESREATPMDGRGRSGLPRGVRPAPAALPGQQVCR